MPTPNPNQRKCEACEYNFNCYHLPQIKCASCCPNNQKKEKNRSCSYCQYCFQEQNKCKCSSMSAAISKLEPAPESQLSECSCNEPDLKCSSCVKDQPCKCECHGWGKFQNCQYCSCKRDENFKTPDEKDILTQKRLLNGWRLELFNLTTFVGRATLIENLLKAKDHEVAEKVKEAMRVERERCVEIVESLQSHWDAFGYPVKGSQTVQREILRAIKDKISESPKD